MARFSPRICREMSAYVLDPTGKRKPALLTDIGLGGARLAVNDRWSGDLKHAGLHDLEIQLDHKETLGVRGAVVWKDGKSAGLRFASIHRRDLPRIWDLIREPLDQSSHCPYCNSLRGESEICPNCHWKLAFLEPSYFGYWEREANQRYIEHHLHRLDLDGLQRLSRYLDEDILHKTPLSSVEEKEEFVGTCEAMQNVFSLIRKVSHTDLPVLILGESGTGKDLTARAVHERSTRSDKPFAPVNCAAIPEPLIEAELFGFEKGAFTGAYQPKKGKFEYAGGGTIFLDEIGELPMTLQPKLLRFLETQIIERVGSTKSRRIDVRIIAATNRNLEEAVNSGNFRPDLYHRIKVLTIELPPLRDRGADKAVLAQYCLKKIRAEHDRTCKGFTSQALEAIERHNWPGNVREMINKIRRAVVVQDGWIEPEDLELNYADRDRTETKLKAAGDRQKKEMITLALQDHHFNVTKAARSLGISRQYLYLLMKKLRIGG